MSETQLPQLWLQTNDDVAELVPYLLGFEPEESLVLAIFRGNRLQLTARADLAQVRAPGEAEHLVGQIWGRYPDADAYLLAYTSDHQAGWTLLQRLSTYLPSAAVRQALLVDGDIWQSSDGDRGTVNRDGHIAAQAVGHGLQRHSSRAELTNSLASPPLTDSLARQVIDALNDLPDDHDRTQLNSRFIALMRANLVSPDQTQKQPMTTAEAAQLGSLIDDHDFCTIALLSITAENAPQHIDLWRNVVNRIPAPLAATPLYLLGMAAWAGHEGAIASIALDRCWQVSPDAGPIRSGPLFRVIEDVIPPSAWEGRRSRALAKANPQIRAAVADLTSTHSTSWEAISSPAPAPSRPATGPAPSSPSVSI
ncbi:MAG: DUF4192 domain-containing protein [Propionibacteriaceae bacterium]|nr:DUF4192 domain-containing protein [Actinomycetota bacterium]MCW5953248.1 DUF4192 domain-containing protein [Propionibacteriaceae bacterium]